MAQSFYYVDVRNAYLGRYRRVTGRTRREAELKAAQLSSQWTEQESRARYRQAVADAKAEALALTEDAQAAIIEHTSILWATLGVDDRVPWDQLLRERPFDEDEPSLAEVSARLAVPDSAPILEFVGIRSKSRRSAKEADARSLYADEVEGFRVRKEKYEANMRAALDELRELKDSYERGTDSGVERYIALVLSRSRYPVTYPGVVRVSYVAAELLVIVDIDVPRLDEFPRVERYRLDIERSVLVGAEMSDQKRAALYDELVYQTVLRTIHETLEGDYAEYVQRVCVNAYATAVEPATGREKRVCLATCAAERGTFETFDLERVQPRACFRTLNGLVGRAPSAGVGVQPLRVATSEDDGIGIDLGDRGDSVPDDLLAMDPFAFEHLVGALFRRIYEGAQATVDVTKASGDGGIDVVVLDQDPIKGGTTIIQVKRYGGVIGVGYVRELYGTMTAVRAARGVLVGTGRYGADAHAFVDDKPITLIDGDALLSMLSAHGWHYRIGGAGALATA